MIRHATLADAAAIAAGLIAIAQSVRPDAHPSTNGAESPPSQGPQELSFGLSVAAYDSRLPEAVSPREFEYALAFLQAPDRLALVAEEDGRRLGFLLAETGPGAVPSLSGGLAGTIAACFVEPDARRRGISKALVAQAETWFREKGVRFAELSFGPRSETAGPAWAAQGYAPFRVFAVKDLGSGETPEASPKPSL